MKTKTWTRLAMAGVLLMTFTTGCTSSRGYQQALDEKEAEIRSLRDERSSLKAQIQSLKSSLDGAQGELANASALRSEPEAAPVQFPELDQVGVTYGMRDGNMVISVPASITFASGQATLSNDGKKALKEVASTLKGKYAGSKYSIEGHTDADPIKKSKFASNRELSLARASAVHAYLVEDCGVSDEQCIVAGHGQYDPVGSNSGDKEKARNRRVEIVVHMNS